MPYSRLRRRRGGAKRGQKCNCYYPPGHPLAAPIVLPPLARARAPVVLPPLPQARARPRPKPLPKPKLVRVRRTGPVLAVPEIVEAQLIPNEIMIPASRTIRRPARARNLRPRSTHPNDVFQLQSVPKSRASKQFRVYNQARAVPQETIYIRRPARARNLRPPTRLVRIPKSGPSRGVLASTEPYNTIPLEGTEAQIRAALPLGFRPIRVPPIEEEVPHYTRSEIRNLANDYGIQLPRLPPGTQPLNINGSGYYGGTRRRNPWVSFLKRFARANRITYAEALKDPRARSQYYRR